MPGSLFAQRDFRLLLVGQTTSQLGAQVASVALPLLAVLTLGATSLEVGLINAASMIAFVLLGLPAGAWLDRWPRRPVLIASDVVRAVLIASVPVVAMLGWLTIGQLITVSLLAGAARVFFDVGYRSYLPAVIGRERVLAGNSALEFVRASGQVLGPGLGGVLVGLLSAANVLWIQAGAFAVSALSLLAIRSHERVVPTGGRVRLSAEIREGLNHLWHHRVLRATAIAGALGNLSFAVASAVTMIFMVRTLALTPAAIGLIIAAGSGTVMLGAALTPRAARRVGSARLIWLCLAVTAPLGLLTALARPGWSVALLGVGIAAGELGQIVFAISSVSLRQRLCPDRLLGRVNASMTVLVMGLFPLGAVAGGLLGRFVGARVTIVIAGTLLIIAPVVLYTALRGVRDVDELVSPRPAGPG